MAKWRLVWTEDRQEHELRFSNDAGVLSEVARLHSLARRPCVIVEVLREPSGSPSMGLALGATESVVTFQGTEDPPYFISLGNPTREGESEPMLHGMQAIEHLARNLVPWAAAESALKDFLATEKRPTQVEWERL